jgi:hypothetical protein
VDVVFGPTTQVGAGADEVGLIGGSDRLGHRCHAGGPGGSLALVGPDGVREIDFTLHRDAYEVTLESFAAACGSSGPQAISGLEGLRALSVAPAVKQSSTSGRTEAVEIEPPLPSARRTVTSSTTRVRSHCDAPRRCPAVQRKSPD